jgi:hypothetical protein
MAVSHHRMLFVFGIVVAPILARSLSTFWERYDSRHDHPWANAMLIAGSLLTILLAFPDQSNLARQVELRSPANAVRFINTHHLSGRMLNEYVYGGYLIWALPESPVFIDGRGDVFEWTGILDEFGRWATLQSDPNALLDKYHIDFCLLALHSPMARVLPLLHGWKLVYQDDNAVIFVRSAPGTTPL